MPLERKVVVCVGALNRSHKRTDYVIREIAQMESPKPFLVLLGQFESDTQTILAEANLTLGLNGFRAATVSPHEVTEYYRAADVFTLGSTKEGFGRVFVEAMTQGLICVVHDGPVQRYVVGNQGMFVDMHQPRALASALRKILNSPDTVGQKKNRSQEAIDRFGWDQLADRYVEMIQRCAVHKINPIVL